MDKTSNQTCGECQHSVKNSVTMLDGRVIFAEFGLMGCEKAPSGVGFYPTVNNVCKDYVKATR